MSNIALPLDCTPVNFEKQAYKIWKMGFNDTARCAERLKNKEKLDAIDKKHKEQILEMEEKMRENEIKLESIIKDMYDSNEEEKVELVKWCNILDELKLNINCSLKMLYGKISYEDFMEFSIYWKNLDSKRDEVPEDGIDLIEGLQIILNQHNSHLQ